MEFSRLKNLFVVLIMIEALTAGISFFLQDINAFAPYQADTLSNSQRNVLTEINNTQTNDKKIQELLPPQLPLLPQKLSNPPGVIKAVYVTGYSAGTKSYLNYLTNLFKTTEINAVAVDIKGSDGRVDAIADINSLVRFFHDKNIYVIGRIAVFEDPLYSKARPDLAVYNKLKTTDKENPVLWQDNNRLFWLDPASKEVWDYNISLAKDALSHGFDEINFDYIRFPSDGDMENLGFPVWDQKIPKSEIIKEFFQYLRQQLAGEKISADLFGQTTVNTDDMGIGQILEDAFESFDYLSPMVYPSHYISGFIGFENPAEHPYQVVEYSMQSALNRQKFYLQSEKIKNSEVQGSPAAESQQILNSDLTIKPSSKFRPWLQDFDIGADYTADMVKQEIKAVKDALGNDFNGFMLWNPYNIYTTGAISKTK